MKETPYEVLGVPPIATPEEIKAAYRGLVRICHPDRNGSDPEKVERFKRVQKAFETVGDEERRRRYDQTGDTGNAAEQRLRNGSLGLLNDMLRALVLTAFKQGRDLEAVEFVLEIETDIRQTISQLKQAGKGIPKNLAKLKAAAKRFKVKAKGGENLMLDLMNSLIRDAEGDQANLERKILIYEEALKILKQHEYKYKAKTQEVVWGTATVFFFK